MRTSWLELISNEMNLQGDSFYNVEVNTLSMEDLRKPFDNGFGVTRGEPFTLWTKKRVYFPVVYDGYESCGSVSRNPDGIKTNHIGGGC